MPIDVRRAVRTAAALCATAVATTGCAGATSTFEPHSVPQTVTDSVADVQPTNTTPGALVAACDLITQQDSTEAFGEPAIAGTNSRDECWWFTADNLKTVNIIRRSDDVETWRSGYQNEFWVPNGLGDEGYSGKTLDSVVFRVGAIEYEINVVYSTSGDPRQVVNDLAAKVISRL